MTADAFQKILDARICAIHDVLEKKAHEYVTTDRLHNFKEAAGTFECTPTEACWSYMMKHLISIKDIAYGRKPITASAVAEKIGDAICYMILMEALLLESLVDQTGCPT